MLADDVTVPPHCQLDVLTDTLYRQLLTKANPAPQVDKKDQGVAWTTETSELRKGLHVARTFIPGRAQGVPVRLMNSTNLPVHLRRGAQKISELHPVTALTEQPEQPTTMNSMSEAEIMDNTLSRVSEDVYDEIKDKLRAQHISVFSSSEYDLGWTDFVTHRIDTSDCRPIRQQLRRYPPTHDI